MMMMNTPSIPPPPPRLPAALPLPSQAELRYWLPIARDVLRGLHDYALPQRTTHRTRYV